MSVSPVSATSTVHWAVALDQVAQRLAARFSRAEPRRRALAYLKGLLSPLARKNGWQLAAQAGDPSPYGVQHLLGRAAWDADKVRDDLRAYVVDHLGDAEGVLISDRQFRRFLQSRVLGRTVHFYTLRSVCSGCAFDEQR